ncbi:hypothetical protein KPL26_13585 [Clostridium algidicarnis]|uniref:hypothetical protein n=1 Tax=Clostridium algidicarnis TaxID=37659 RepID=UPI001C0B0997|nr:hypothetical protein [Clostridium algidicarnis]MBU3197664.1 hypothetical protein [Clostridium algidicarnis]
MAFELYGITEYLLQELSCQSRLDRSLKNTLRKFNKNDLINEILDIKEFYESTHLLDDVRFSYRIKSLQSCMLKYDKYYPNIEVSKCYNDLLGIRIIVSDYNEILNQDLSIFRVADMRNGKVKDDGYRGIHLYYQRSNRHYPIEIQVNSKKDRKLNDWLHIYLYKHTRDNSIGVCLRKKYEDNEIKSEEDFKEVLKYVLFDSKEV